MIDIEDTEPKYSESHYGIDVNTSVRQYQGSYELPEEIEYKVKQFYEYMDKEEYNKAKKLLDELIIETKPEYPLIADMKAMLDIETEFAEDVSDFNREK